MYVPSKKVSEAARRFRSVAFYRPRRLGAIDDPLSEVQVKLRRIEEPMPEIVVQAKRIPWYVWAVLGAVAAAFLLGVKRK